MENTLIKLLDHRGHVIWASNETGWEKPFFEYVHEEHRDRVYRCLSECVVRGAQTTCQARVQCPPNGTVPRQITFFPVERTPDGSVEIGSLASVVVSHTLPDNFEAFTDQDRELLSLLGSDLSIPQISEQLGRSPSTIDTRIRSLKEKLGQRTLHGLVSAAMRSHLIDGLPIPQESDSSPS